MRDDPLKSDFTIDLKHEVRFIYDRIIVKSSNKMLLVTYPYVADVIAGVAKCLVLLKMLLIKE